MGLLVVALVLVPMAEAAQTSKPNILFFLTDDQPQNCMACMGNEHIQTPNMDRLAADGMLFTNSFVTTAICCSNRACILTGQHMRRHGITDFQTPLSAEAFAQTYPALLRKAGYRTGYLGKFPIGSPNPEIKHLSLPAEQFDFWFGFPQMIDFKQQVNGQVRYLTTVIEEKAVEFLRSNPPNQPFCLTVALKEPHGPWNYYDPDVPNPYENIHIPPPPTFTPGHFEALPEFIRSSLNGELATRWFKDPNTYQNHVRTYYRLITRADIALGRIMAALQETGLDENTVVIFSSDNGSMLGAHGLDGKWLMYEESIRVPLIIRDPRLPKELRGRRCERMVLSIDLAPTMLSLAGVPIPSAMQGRDLTPLLSNPTLTWREDWYYEHVYNTKPPRRPIVKCEGVRTERWKYVRYPEIEPPYEQLFDLQNDPYEEHNLANDPNHTEQVSRLREGCDKYRLSLK